MSFDRLAPHYRWMETLLAGSILQRCRTRWLADAPSPRRALLAGEGPGRMLDACAQVWPGCEFTVLDVSRGMLNQARRRWRQGSDGPVVNFIAADAREWAGPRGKFDVVVTNFFLDCFAPDDLKRVIENLSAVAAPGATWLVSDFKVPPAGWRHWRARFVLALAYGFFRIATDISARRITPPDEYLRAAGFVLRRRTGFNFGLLHADLWQRLDFSPTHERSAGGTHQRNSHRNLKVAMADERFSTESV